MQGLTSFPKIEHIPLFCAAGLIVAPTQAPKKKIQKIQKNKQNKNTSLYLLLTGPSDNFPTIFYSVSFSRTNSFFWINQLSVRHPSANIVREA